MGEERKLTAEEKEAAFRELLEDCIELSQKFASHCKDLREFHGLMSTAVEQSREGNDALLRLMMSTVSGTGRK